MLYRKIKQPFTPPKFLLLLLSCGWFLGNAQSKTDSLRSAVANTQIDSTLGRLYVEWGTELYQTKPDSAQILWHKALNRLAGVVPDEPEETRRIKLLKSEALNNLGIVAEKMNKLKEALQFYQDALAIRREVNDIDGLIVTLNNLGVYFRKQGYTEAALKYYKESLQLARNIGNRDQEISILIHLALLYQNAQFNEAAGDYYRQALALVNEQEAGNARDRIYNGLGGLMEETGKPDSSLHYYRKSYQLRKKANDPKAKATICLNLAKLFVSMGRADSADKYLAESFQWRQNVNELTGLALVYVVASENESLKKNSEKSIELGKKALELARKTDNSYELRAASDRLYQAYRDAGKTRESLEMLEIKLAVEDSIQNSENARLLMQEKFKMDYERIRLSDSLEFAKEREIQNLKLAETNARLQQQRIGLISAAGILLLVILLAYVIYTGKRKSEKLLLNILPKEIAKELKKYGRTAARNHECVTVLFTDFKSFTEESARMTPEELVAEVDHCFSAFDRISEKYGIEKIKTIGDAYMAVSGLPSALPDHAIKAALAALEMMQFIQKRREECAASGKKTFELRIGINSGPVVAGIVGQTKFQYDVWGDTVNTAARMESAADVGKINVSESSYELLKDHFEWEYRGLIPVKGKGPVPMYYLLKAL